MGLRGGTLVGGWKGAMFKDWTVATQGTAGSGLPLTPIYLAAVRGTGVTGSIRPDYTGDDLYAAPARPAPQSRRRRAARARTLGPPGRNSITGPAQFNMSASLARTFRFTDRINADFRTDAQNQLNNVTFPSWSTVITSAQFGLPATANPMRSVSTNLRVRF